MTWATPLIMEMRWASRVSANSLTWYSGSVGEDTARYRMGWSAGLTLRSTGGVGRSEGRLRWAEAMAACTSWAAASMLRSRLNCRVMRVFPSVLVEVMESMPETLENSFSSGVAMLAAMVSGLAPGMVAETCRVGKSTLGRSLTGSLK